MSDWSSDVCSADLWRRTHHDPVAIAGGQAQQRIAHSAAHNIDVQPRNRRIALPGLRGHGAAAAVSLTAIALAHTATQGRSTFLLAAGDIVPRRGFTVGRA